MKTETKIFIVSRGIFLLAFIVGFACFSIVEKKVDAAKRDREPVASATATLRADPTARIEPIKETSMPAGVLILPKPVDVYTFYTTEAGQRIYKQTGVAAARSLAKISACVNGWMQIEYEPNPFETPGYWRVGWAPCNGQ